MTSSFKVVDLFAGPGGLAEGFSQFRDDSGQRAFEICLSIEKEASAFATLRLRSFVRQFDEIPAEYYHYIAGEIDRDRLVSKFPEQWTAACAETLQLELGAEGVNRLLDPKLDEIRESAGGNLVLIGGPPCQAYSIVGRSRNQGNADYVASEDHRHFLYEEYIRILGRLQPAAFVMENVKGILSSSVEGERIFTKVLSDLRDAGGDADAYQLVPLTVQPKRRSSEHVLEAERFGIPQCRHRVILFGVRRDRATAASLMGLPGHILEPLETMTTVADVLADMPPLRSGLSRVKDSPEAWKEAAVSAFRQAAQAALSEEDEALDRVASRLAEHMAALEAMTEVPPLVATRPASVRNNVLADWLIDSRLTVLPNHVARNHMASDLARYAFAAVFTEQVGRSPKAHEFPSDLAPAHQNWRSGKFKDRFRVQRWDAPSTTVTSHIHKDGHYFIHPDALQCRTLSVREAARLQTFPDNYFFEGSRTEQYIQVGNAVPPLLAFQIASVVHRALAS